MNRMFYTILAATMLITSCTSIQEPTIERIVDVKLIEMTKSNLELNANMVVMNPNGFALDLDKADLDVFLDDIELAKIDQTYETNMPENKEFKIPIHIKMDLDKLYRDNPMEAISKGLQIMSNRKLNVQFKGTISVGKGMAKISVPVDQMEEVAF